MHGETERDRSMTRAATGGLFYFGLVFATGFALGTVRVLALIPRLGETVSVLIELPAMLAVSWIACRWVIARVGVPGTHAARVCMGGIAFAMLMLAEFGLSVLAFGRMPAEHLELYRDLPGLLGLAGQIAFAVFPLIQRTGR
jgi:hypothetical protein